MGGHDAGLRCRWLLSIYWEGPWEGQNNSVRYKKIRSKESPGHNFGCHSVHFIELQTKTNQTNK